MKPYAKKFYNSKQWRDCRQSYIQERILIDGGLCEECHNNPGYIVHHKVMITPANINNPDITLNHCNLEYVCKDCHDRFDDHFVKTKKPSCMFDNNGQPIPPIVD